MKSLTSHKNSSLLMVLIGLTLCFIWGNSLMPASISGAISAHLKDAINLLLGDAGSSQSLSGDGLLRKLAHASEFAVLGAELTLLLRVQFKRGLPFLLLTGLSTALVDETIQLFSDGRSAQIKDVWIDLGGFIVGCLVTAAIAALYARHRPQKRR